MLEVQNFKTLFKSFAPSIIENNNNKKYTCDFCEKKKVLLFYVIFDGKYGITVDEERFYSGLTRVLCSEECLNLWILRICI